MNDHLLIRLSQSHLNLLETCPPQFKRIYLEQLGSPLSPEQQEKLTWGSQFHLLMQQRELGLSIDSILGEEQQFKNSLQALIDAVPCLDNLSSQSWKEAEHCRTLALEGYLLTVIYDLLITERNKAEILDWKTYLQPENTQKLANHWQTRLYLYLLAETSDYLPEQISLTYWFVKLPNKPQSLTFSYDNQQHQKNHQDLIILLNNLQSWLEDYSQKQRNFPHLDNCQESCPYYKIINDLEDKALTNKNNPTDLLLTIEEIEEIPLW
ncbi:MAG TPA: PD-(D/E)XK nuclease family protein [Cyanothece sp. UBA12306]|nr:PD-(D/E)XK nuclease family protein [Cyanothece sp. UBA12306]